MQDIYQVRARAIDVSAQVNSIYWRACVEASAGSEDADGQYRLGIPEASRIAILTAHASAITDFIMQGKVAVEPGPSEQARPAQSCSRDDVTNMGVLASSTIGVAAVRLSSSMGMLWLEQNEDSDSDRSRVDLIGLDLGQATALQAALSFYINKLTNKKGA